MASSNPCALFVQHRRISVLIRNRRGHLLSCSTRVAEGWDLFHNIFNMLAMSLLPLQARPSGLRRHPSCRSVFRVARHQRSGVRAQATQQDLDSFVMIPWAAAEESWSDESAEMMESLVAKFKAADKDGCAGLCLLKLVGGGIAPGYDLCSACGLNQRVEASLLRLTPVNRVQGPCRSHSGCRVKRGCPDGTCRVVSQGI